MNGAIVRIGLLVLLGVCVTAAGAVLWNHYSNLVDAKADLSSRVTGLEKDVATATARADALDQVVATWNEASERQVDAISELTTAQRQAGTYQRELTDVLSKHDISLLAKKRPKLIETRVNTGTGAALRMLERATEPPATSAPGATAASPGIAGSDAR